MLPPVSTSITPPVSSSSSRAEKPKLATAPVSDINARLQTASDNKMSGAAESSAKTGRPDGVKVEVKASVQTVTPPVDQERVAQIKSALQNGTYPIKPTKIADAMIAARFMLGYGE